MSKPIIILHDLLNNPMEVEIDAITLISPNTTAYAATAKSVVRIDGETHAVRETEAEIDALKKAADNEGCTGTRIEPKR